MRTTRPYTMRTRAEGVARTRARILEATWTLTGEVLLAQLSLDAVAARAGVSVQTVLRQFGSRAGLLEATRQHATSAVEAERRPPVGDRSEAMRVLLDHYELRGDAVLLLLSQESSDPLVRSITDQGRRLHREWVRTVFADELAPAGTAEDARDAASELEDLLVVATDVFTWKLLRRDRDLSRTRTEARMNRLADAVLAAAGRTVRSAAADRQGATDG